MREVALVVGATGAIGSAAVARLAARGLRVVAVARSSPDLEKLAADLPGVVPCVADIGSNDAIETINAAIDAPVRLAVFAAGLPVRGSVVTIDPDLLAVGAGIKLGGVLRMVRAVDPHLQRGSRIVCFAGSLGLEPRATEAGPGAINAGLFNLMRQLSLNYGPRGITTHTISPGPADTPRLRAIAETVAAESGRPYDEVWASYTSANSLGRLPTADEIAWGVTLLLDPEADVMHGGVLYLDAGGHRGIH
jgi:NAD(P)-dependent dehydrogenase (short-subunit alcohol dehydrogenase family)